MSFDVVGQISRSRRTPAPQTATSRKIPISSSVETTAARPGAVLESSVSSLTRHAGVPAPVQEDAEQQARAAAAPKPSANGLNQSSCTCIDECGGWFAYTLISATTAEARSASPSRSRAGTAACGPRARSRPADPRQQHDEDDAEDRHVQWCCSTPRSRPNS